LKQCGGCCNLLAVSSLSHQRAMSKCRNRSYRDLRRQLGGCKPGDSSHALICEPVSACRALRISSSRASPGGSCKASSRRRFASCANRTSRLVDWMIVPPLAQGRTYKEGCNCVNAAFLTRRLQFRDAFVHTFGLSSETSEHKLRRRGPCHGPIQFSWLMMTPPCST
jgi:hypothetical protein